jgi:hypothetical protein
VRTGPTRVEKVLTVIAGIEIGAERVTKEIEDEIDRLSKTGVEIDRLSVVGYSLGGIVGRFTVGLLYHRGYFDRLRPMVSAVNQLRPQLTCLVFYNFRYSSSWRSNSAGWIR